mgnify:CR=1 FL=1
MNTLALLNSRLGRVEIWSRQFAVASAILFAILTLLFDCVLLNSWSPLWIPIAIAAYLESFFLVVLLKRYVLTRLLARRSMAWLNLLIAGIIGSLHNLTVAISANWLGLLGDDIWAFRIVGGFQLGFFFLLFFGISFGARIEHRALISELARQNERLTYVRGTALKRLNQERKSIADATRGALLPRLEELQQLVQSRQSRLAVIDTFRQIIQNDVRPANEELQRRAVDLEAWEYQPTEDAPKRVHVGAGLTMREILSPGPSTLLGMTIVWAVAYIVMGQPEAGNVFVSGLLMYPVLWLARRFFPVDYRPAAAASTCWLIVMGLVSSALPLAVAFYLTNPTNTNQLLWCIPVALCALLVLVAEANSLEHYRVAVRARMAKINEAIEYEIALFDQKLWLTRRAWQFAVHGSVQAALTAALTRMQDPNLSDTELLVLVQSDLERAIKALEEVESKPLNLAEAMADIQSTWAGVCRVELNFSDRASHALLGNNDASVCVNEIVKEAVNNSVRHAQAKNIIFEVDVHGALVKGVLDHMAFDGLENAYDGKPMGNFADKTAEKMAGEPGFLRRPAPAL